MTAITHNQSADTTNSCCYCCCQCSTGSNSTPLDDRWISIPHQWQCVATGFVDGTVPWSKFNRRWCICNINPGSGNYQSTFSNYEWGPARDESIRGTIVYNCGTPGAWNLTLRYFDTAFTADFTATYTLSGSSWSQCGPNTMTLASVSGGSGGSQPSTLTIEAIDGCDCQPPLWCCPGGGVVYPDSVILTASCPGEWVDGMSIGLAKDGGRATCGTPSSGFPDGRHPYYSYSDLTECTGMSGNLGCAAITSTTGKWTGGASFQMCSACQSSFLGTCVSPDYSILSSDLAEFSADGSVVTGGCGATPGDFYVELGGGFTFYDRYCAVYDADQDAVEFDHALLPGLYTIYPVNAPALTSFTLNCSHNFTSLSSSVCIYDIVNCATTGGDCSGAVSCVNPTTGCPLFSGVPMITIPDFNGSTFCIWLCENCPDPPYNTPRRYSVNLGYVPGVPLGCAYAVPNGSGGYRYRIVIEYTVPRFVSGSLVYEG